ncbi:outer membrane protein [Nostoc sp. NIES-4103]|nr:outer membrane protein [Nostoc sp. NIES-4103]
MPNFKILSTSLVAIGLSLATGCTPASRQNQNTSEAPPVTGKPVQATNSPSPSVSPTVSPTTPGQNNLSSSDRQFINEAAQGGLAEVQLGQLASQRAGNNAVKEFGQRMVTDHTQVNNQLKQLATQKGVTLPTTLDSKNQQLKQRLSRLSGANFDREYMNQMVQDHQKDVSAFQTEAQQGQDPDVKAFAAQALPTLQEHLQQARSIVNAGTSTTTPTPTTTPTSTTTPTPTTTP